MNDRTVYEAQLRIGERRLLAAKRNALEDAFRRGLISEETLAASRRDIDAGLAENGKES